MQDRMRKRVSLLGKWAVCLSLLLAIFLPVYSRGAETVIMKVLLNTEDKGEHFLLLTEEGDILFKLEELKETGLREIPVGAGIDGRGYVSLKSLSPGVSFETDEKAAILRITAAPELLERRVIDLAYRRPGKVLRTRGNAAFINYSLNYNMGDDLEFISLSLPFEQGVSINDYFAYSNFSYTKTDTEERLVRLMTNITNDDPETLRRYIVGDFSASSGGQLGSGGTFGGLSISKDFSTSPYFIKSSGVDISGVLKTPSEVEVYVNDLLVKKEHLHPGEFEFLNLPNTAGAGEATLVIKDAFGGEERITVPFYVSTVLLKPGLHEYAYNLGFRRAGLGQESFEYEDPAFVGFHRLGLTEALTAGFRAEADKEVVNLGPEARFHLGAAGEVDTSVAYSLDDGVSGYGGSLSYIYTGRGLSGRFSVRGFSREYANLTLAASRDKARFTGSLGLGYNHKVLGSVSVTFSDTDMYTGTDMSRTSLFYSRRLKRGVSLFVRADRTETETVTDSAFAGLNYSFGKGGSGSLGYQTQEGRTTETATFQKNPPLGTGLSYRFDAQRRETGEGEKEMGGGAATRYRGRYAIYSADWRHSGAQNSYSLNVSGGVAFINRSVYPSRPINDSFALVKVGNLKGVRVSRSNQEAGTTNRRGEVLVPGLISYYDNKLSIDDKDIPVNYDIREIERHVSTPLRGGSLVSFEVVKLQGFVGRLFLMEEGEKTPAEYWGLEIRLKDRKVEVIVGKGAEFYLENIPAGTYPARLFLKDRSCRFDITIPESDDMMVYMGEISCEMD